MLKSPKSKPINPYHVSTPILENDRFYGRQDIVRDVVNTFVRTKQNSVVLHGQPRIGKSSLLYRLKHDEDLGNIYHPIFFDRSLYLKFSLAKMLEVLGKKIVKALNLTITPPNEASLADDYHRFDQVFLPEIHQYTKKRLLFLFDEFESASISLQEDPLPVYLRTLTTQVSGQPAFVFVVGRRLELLPENHKRLFKEAIAKLVSTLNKKDTIDLLADLGREVGIDYEDKALDEIWNLTQGHPYFTQLMGMVIFDFLDQDLDQARKVSKDDVITCIPKVRDEAGRLGLIWIKDNLSHHEMLILGAIAGQDRPHRPISDQVINETLENHNISIHDDLRNSLYNGLIKDNFLEVEERGYLFTIEFIRLWIKDKYDIEAQLKELHEQAGSFFDKGVTAVLDGKPDEAIDYFQQALALNSEFFDARMRLGQTLLVRDYLEEAIHELRIAFEQNPNPIPQVRKSYIDALLKKANRVRQSSNDDEALNCIDKVLDIDIEHTEARELKGDICLEKAEKYWRANQRVQAFTIIEEVLTVPLLMIKDSDFVKKVRDMWEMYAQNHPDQRKDILRDLTKLGIKTNNQRISVRVKSYLEDGDLGKALDTLKEVNPNLDTNHVIKLIENHSNQHIERGQWTVAEKLRVALHEHLNNSDTKDIVSKLWKQWGDTLLTQGKYAQAREIYQKLDPEESQPKIENTYDIEGQTAIKQHNIDRAFECFEWLVDANRTTYHHKIKNTVHRYVEDKKSQQKWADAVQVLERLQHLPFQDLDTTLWYAYVQHDWAKALYSDHRKSRQAILSWLENEAPQAKKLCHNLLNDIDTGVLALGNKEKQELSYNIRFLLTKIVRSQAQICLNKDDFQQAEDFFGEALLLYKDNPQPLPIDIVEDIKSFSKKRANQEQWDKAKATWEIASRLELVTGNEVEQRLVELTVQQAFILLKADRPTEALKFLDDLNKNATGETSNMIYDMVYDFSRLYAGRHFWTEVAERHFWTEAKEALSKLREWASPENSIGLNNTLEALNEEHLYWYENQPDADQMANSSPEKLERLRDKFQHTCEAYVDAVSQGGDASKWTRYSTQAGLELCQAFLANQAWDEAKNTLERLKTLELPAPDGRIKPDPFFDGVIQRIILVQVKFYLEQERLDEAFAAFGETPRPWPESTIKEIIRNFVNDHFAQNKWEKALEALEYLDSLLADNRNGIRDQDVLTWCVEGLEKWGQEWEKVGTNEAWNKAAECYDRGLTYTREAAQLKGNDKLTERFVAVALKLAEGWLYDRFQENETSVLSQQGFNWCKKILDLPECELNHQQQINELVHKRAVDLTEQSMWDGAYNLIDSLNKLYESPSDEHRYCFATWQRELALHELDKHLEAHQFIPAFDRLRWFQQWLKNYDQPQITWANTIPKIKERFANFQRVWREQKRWQMLSEQMQTLATIIPDDEEIKSWQIETYHEWGQWLYNEKNYGESQKQYERALQIEAAETSITKTGLEMLLFEAQLAQIEEILYLNQPEKLNEVISICEQIIQKQAEYPNNIDTVRQALMNYHDKQITKKPPPWEVLHETLYKVGSLTGIENQEILVLRQRLTGREIHSILESANSVQDLDSVFINLNKQNRVWQLEDVEHFVKTYSRKWTTESNTALLAIEILEHLAVWVAEKSINGKIIEEVIEELNGIKMAYIDQNRDVTILPIAILANDAASKLEEHLNDQQQ